MENDKAYGRKVVGSESGCREGGGVGEVSKNSRYEFTLYYQFIKAIK